MIHLHVGVICDYKSVIIVV